MNKAVVYIFFLVNIFIGSITHAQIDINKVRKDFLLAPENEKVTEKLYKELSDAIPSDYLMQAYKASVLAIKAKHAFWPNDKLKYISQAMSLLEQCIKSSPEHIEIRWLRFSLEKQMPAFLGYNHMQDDQTAIILQLSKLKVADAQSKYIAKFLKQHAKLNSNELIVVNRIILQ